MFLAAVGGSAKAHPIPRAAAVGNGTMTWFRALSASEQVMFDGSVGKTGSGATLNFGITTIERGWTLEVEEFEFMAQRQA